jgi:cytochrome c-type biogenesis protein CcmF
MFPLISEAVRGVKITVGPPTFNKVNAPLGLLLLFLIGVGPIIAWRRASWSSLRRSFTGPVATGFAAGAALAIGGVRSGWALVSFSLVFFVLATIVVEFHRGTRARQAMLGENFLRALGGLISKNRRRYGGYIVHVGVAMIFVAITGTSVFRLEQQVTLNQGQTFDIGGYTLRYNGLEEEDTPHVAILMANVTVLEQGRVIDTLRPEKRFYKKPEQPTTEVAIRSTLGSDLYLVLGSYDGDTKMVTILAYLNPLIAFLWMGGVVIALGTGVVMWPTAAVVRVAATAPQGAVEEA